MKYTSKTSLFADILMKEFYNNESDQNRIIVLPVMGNNDGNNSSYARYEEDILNGKNEHLQKLGKPIVIYLNDQKEVMNKIDDLREYAIQLIKKNWEKYDMFWPQDVMFLVYDGSKLKDNRVETKNEDGALTVKVDKFDNDIFLNLKRRSMTDSVGLAHKVEDDNFEMLSNNKHRLRRKTSK